MLGLSSSSQNTPILSSFGANKKKRKSNSIAGPSSLDEENAPNVSTNIPSDKSDSAKKTKVNKTDSTKKTKVNKMANYKVSTIDAESEYLKLSHMISNPSPNMSECGTEVSTVSERREWLKKFEQKQTNNIFREMDKEKPRNNDDRDNNETRLTNSEKEGRQSPPTSSISSAPTNPSLPATTSVPVISTAILKPMSAKKPRKPNLVNNRRPNSVVGVPSWVASKKEEVKATDDVCASVASLSKWLANDPTSAKKKRHVRRGRNIVSKSRQFENDIENNIVFESKISRGAVGDKKKWLQNAFHSTEEDEDDACSSFSGYVKSDVGRSMRSYPRYNKHYGAQTEIITDDAASSLSVSDKKDWLKKAFNKNSEERKAQTDVMHNRGQGEAASRAKLRFKERSARKLLGANPTARPSANEGNNRSVEPIEEDNTPVDFSAARDALVQRSKQNGHNTQVVNKVYLRKKKIERRVDENRRKSMGMGLVLKTSWELPDDSKGAPSNTYERKLVSVMDIAPKKSFEELP